MAVKHSTLHIFAFREKRDLVTLLAFVFVIMCSILIHKNFEFLNEVSGINKLRTSITLVKNGFIVISGIGLLMVVNNANFFGFNHHSEKPAMATDNNWNNCDFFESDLKPCVFNFSKNSEKTTVALLGDSHAVALTEAVRSAFNNSVEIHVWASTGCKYFWTKSSWIRPIIEEIRDDSCFTKNASFEKYLELIEYDYVFVAWRSQNCSFNSFLGLCGKNFTSLMVESVEHIGTFAKQVWVIGPNPEVSREIPIFKSRSLFSKFLLPKPSYPIVRMDPQPFRDKEFLDSEGVKSLNILDKLCNQIECKIFLNGKFLYSDNNHLSLEGAALYIEQIRGISDVRE